MISSVHDVGHTYGRNCCSHRKREYELLIEKVEQQVV
jgi:hypothetical protein